MQAHIYMKYFRSEELPPIKTETAWTNFVPDKYYNNGIGFEKIVDDISYIDEEINELIDRSDIHKDQISNVLGLFTTELSIVVYSKGQANPGIHINNSVVRRMAQLGGTIDIDIYCIEGNHK
jgi:hypothetical protein